MKNLYILGAAGSIGSQTLDIVRENKDLFKVCGISVGRDLKLAQKIIDEFEPSIVCFRNKEDLDKITTKAITCYGDEGLNLVAAYGEAKDSLLVNALVGAVGLIPTVCAIKHQRDVALANKETLVMAGEIINKLLKEYNVKLYPIDSEHSAIWQCLQGEDINDVAKLIITASGGSFRDKGRDELVNVTVNEALCHPNWKMGKKITIDSATMMNKGFEVIEAYHLFHLPVDKITTVLHRESIVHSLVEFNDGAIKAELGESDMRVPILYALMYPNHKYYSGKKLDLSLGLKLSFEELSEERYPCLGYAYLALKKGGLYPTVLNAANEAAIYLFLNDRIKFLDIERIIYEEINQNYDMINPSLDDIIKVNRLVFSKITNKYGGIN